MSLWNSAGDVKSVSTVRRRETQGETRTFISCRRGLVPGDVGEQHTEQAGHQRSAKLSLRSQSISSTKISLPVKEGYIGGPGWPTRPPGGQRWGDVWAWLRRPRGSQPPRKSDPTSVTRPSQDSARGRGLLARARRKLGYLTREQVDAHGHREMDIRRQMEVRSQS